MNVTSSRQLSSGVKMANLFQILAFGKQGNTISLSFNGFSQNHTLLFCSLSYSTDTHKYIYLYTSHVYVFTPLAFDTFTLFSWHICKCLKRSPDRNQQMQFSRTLSYSSRNKTRNDIVSLSDSEWVWDGIKGERMSFSYQKGKYVFLFFSFFRALCLGHLE